MDYFLIQLIIFIGLLALVAILPSIIILLISRKKTNLSLKYISVLFLSAVQIWIFYSIYTAIYPNDSFYFEEYVTVIGKSAPKSAKIINKSASFPDIHGSYESASLIKLSELDYNALTTEIDLSKNFKDADLIGSETLENILDSNEDINGIIWKERKNTDEIWQNCFIGFLNKQKMVIIYYVKH